jgi:hypothetical protein
MDILAEPIRDEFTASHWGTNDNEYRTTGNKTNFRHHCKRGFPVALNWHKQQSILFTGRERA